MSEEREQLGYAPHGRLATPIAPEKEPSMTKVIALATARFVGLRLAVLGFSGLLLAGLWSGVAPGVAILAGVAIFVLLPAWAGTMRQMRRRRAAVVLGFLEQAARLNLPLPMMLDAASRSETRKTAKRLGRLRDLIEDGAPVELALKSAVSEVPPRTLALIGAAERLGRLRPALTRIVREERDDTQADAERPARDVLSRWYPVLMICAMTFIVLMVAVFVMPKMEDIFRDFGLRLPRSTRLMIEVSRGLTENLWIPFLVLSVLAMMLGGSFHRLFTDRSELPRFPLTDYLAWWLPLAHGLQRDRGLADACRVMADALATGRPLPRAVDEAAAVDVNEVLRARLRRWRRGVENGMAADEAARAARLPGLVAGMIGSGRGGDPAGAMEFLAAYYAARFSRTRELLRAAAGPVIVLVFGGIVLFLIAAMYAPIIGMMDALAGSVGRLR